MKDPDRKYFIGSPEPGHWCNALPTGKYRIASLRRASLVVKDVAEPEARAFCKKHKLDFPSPVTV